MQQEDRQENRAYLQEQIITYIGNKRKLLDHIGAGVAEVQKRLGRTKLRCFDAFSGSGVVSRYLKRFSTSLYSNDLEPYAHLINRCYLANSAEVAAADLPDVLAHVRRSIADSWAPGLVAELYAPQDDTNIQAGERVFYTRRNAVYLDTARRVIGKLPQELQHFFLAPLLYEASVHTNTSGIFKGFHKNEQGIGQFGGRGRNALSRIMADIELPLPVFSRFDCELHLTCMDATQAALALPEEVDLAYLDPPYNQHPYGSNYFMLNFLLEYKRPAEISPVSGIPAGWRHSAYNARSKAADALECMLACLRSKFALLSYSSEGIIPREDILRLASRGWKVELVQEQPYATFRGCRNLRSRPLGVKEYLFLLERK